MKIIHTGDLHIGKILYGEEMAENHQAFFDQLAQAVANEQPEALLISGDVYETSNPSVAARRLFCDNLLRIHNILPTMMIVVISGNHDSSQRLGAESGLWQLANVRIITTIAGNGIQADYDEHLIELMDAQGATCAWLGAVPFAYEQNFPKGAEDENRITAFYKGLLHRMDERNSGNHPRLLMGHLTVAPDLDFSGHRIDSIGGIESVGISDFSGEYDYFALGHIHHPQFVKGTEHKARYAGTPLPVSFDEPFRHTISIVAFDGQNEPHVSELPIHVPHPLVTVPKDPAPFADAIKALEEFPWDGTEYVRLNVKQETAPADALARAEECLHNTNSKLLTINYVRSNTPDNASMERGVTLSEFRNLSPLEVARISLGDRLTEELEELFNEVLARLDD